MKKNGLHILASIMIAPSVFAKNRELQKTNTQTLENSAPRFAYVISNT